MNSIEDLNYIGLMTYSFLAATVIPLSSEAALATALAFSKDRAPLLFFATIGNCAGVVFNFWLGWKGEEKFLRKNLQKKSVARAYKIMQRWGKWSLIFSWMPVIGDPITVLAGVLKLNIFIFALVTFSLRFLRYLFIVGLFSL